MSQDEQSGKEISDTPRTKHRTQQQAHLSDLRPGEQLGVRQSRESEGSRPLGADKTPGSKDLPPACFSPLTPRPRGAPDVVPSISRCSCGTISSPAALQGQPPAQSSPKEVLVGRTDTSPVKVTNHQARACLLAPSWPAWGTDLFQHGLI